MVIVLICSVVGYVFIEQKDKSFTNTSSGMGVQVHQMLYGNEAELAAKTVRESIEELENKISYDIAESDIERINSGAGEKWVRVSDETIDALDKIISVSKKSKGTLDPTVLPLVSLWGLDCNTVKYPQKALIEKRPFIVADDWLYIRRKGIKIQAINPHLIDQKWDGSIDTTVNTNKRKPLKRIVLRNIFRILFIKFMHRILYFEKATL